MVIMETELCRGNVARPLLLPDSSGNGGNPPMLNLLSRTVQAIGGKRGSLRYFEGLTNPKKILRKVVEITEAGKLFKAGDYQGAAKYYERAIAETDSVSTYFSNLAATYLKLSKYHAAQEAARKALVLDPRSFKARYRRAMARKGLNLIPEALVDIAGVLTADPTNSQARTEFAALVEIQNRTGMRPLEPSAILALDFPHAYGSISNPPRPNLTDLHQLSVPFFFKVSADEKPGNAAIEPGVIVGACMTCQVTMDKKKNLRACGKCRRANYCSVECQRADWPMHKYTCGAAPDDGKTMRVGRNIHHHQIFQLHLLFYAVQAMGPPKLPSEIHDFVLMVVIELVPISSTSGSRKTRNESRSKTSFRSQSALFRQRWPRFTAEWCKRRVQKFACTVFG
ncbi:hypothetical protein DFH09DRAFT_1283933 [Mycena vulgaris]|nr:hypothetical protein DFH09DRAFT_1283933 [Mycena vulgaris]